MKIGLFGGTFDPIHKGHIQIAISALKELNLDKIIFIPNNQNPFKKNQPSASAYHRFMMVKIAISNYKKMDVSDFEIKQNGPSHTIDTINYFSNKFKDDELFFIIGSDNIEKINKWRGIDEISRKTQIVAFERKGSTKNKKNIKSFNIIFLKEKILDVSATDYRNGNLKVVVPEVQEYIGQHFLYVKNYLLNNLSVDRSKHCFLTAKYANELAKKLNYNSKTAYYCGLLHDITKEWSVEEHRQYLRKCGVNEKKLFDYELHQETAYFFLKNEYMIKNEPLLDAIRQHTTLSLFPKTLDKIIYVADKVAPGRRWEGIQSLRKLIEENFDNGFKKLVFLTWEKYVYDKKHISKEQEDIYSKNSK
ncbi:nicotinate-nucleotide adenylyltransferase [[Mycoplasma] gypis]|uniref:Probable nicotinate-nucleotide adenylyltransferase n=1 Tax=[Mycoplasma] gypis TaxID=92404 RepID=A0ABZ2RNS5_9BACT|nr:nicotinate-nucleotide adenylyltransferase [[Mycoplasma] gypis]MBN0919166.1 nicotinate-nucleotide adenylyltransferase [[Mycoplasma] gypis]